MRRKTHSVGRPISGSVNRRTLIVLPPRFSASSEYTIGSPAEATLSPSTSTNLPVFVTENSSVALLRSTTKLAALVTKPPAPRPATRAVFSTSPTSRSSSVTAYGTEHSNESPTPSVPGFSTAQMAPVPRRGSDRITPLRTWFPVFDTLKEYVIVVPFTGGSTPSTPNFSRKMEGPTRKLSVNESVSDTGVDPDDPSTVPPTVSAPLSRSACVRVIAAKQVYPPAAPTMFGASRSRAQLSTAFMSGSSSVMPVTDCPPVFVT
mmetsp:Transcript_23900/g.66933  ORF Transcript_23900/g.66933 Transcript_23900/m.66933 type:complete len:262 (-) Transcript_23900:1229-2014(-)